MKKYEFEILEVSGGIDSKALVLKLNEFGSNGFRLADTMQTSVGGGAIRKLFLLEKEIDSEPKSVSSNKLDLKTSINYWVHYSLPSSYRNNSRLLGTLNRVGINTIEDLMKHTIDEVREILVNGTVGKNKIEGFINRYLIPLRAEMEKLV